MGKIFFLHVPKCGGTSLHEFISLYMKKGKICPYRSDVLCKHDPVLIYKYDFLSGHYNYQNTVACLDIRDYYQLTLIRNPKHRIVSMYNFARSHDKSFIVKHSQYSDKPHCYEKYGMCYATAKENSFNNFLKKDYNFLKKSMIKRFCNTESASVDECLTVMQNFDHVGVLEKLDIFYKKIASDLRIKNEYSIPHKVRAEDLHKNYTHMNKIKLKNASNMIKNSLLEDIVFEDDIIYRNYA